MQQHYPQHVHIGGYGERPANGYWPKLWALGPGKDAPKPVSVPKAKREHDRWVRMKKEEPERIDIRYARERLRRAERNGKLIRRDPAASWIGGPPMP